MKIIDSLLLLSSTSIIVTPTTVTYSLTLLFIILKIALGFRNSIQYKHLLIFVTFVLFYTVDILMSNNISFDGFIKNFVLLIIILFGLNVPITKIKIILKFIFFVNVTVTLLNYLIPHVIPLGQVYQTTYFLGRNVNTGIFFELNYSAMFTIAVGFYLYSQDKIKLGLTLLFVFTFYTFRSSILFVPFLFIGNMKLFNKFYFIILLIGLLYIYENFSLLLEQRYFIWKSFFDSYQFQIEKLTDFQSKMKATMDQSPWGYSGLNLHNGFFESFISRGFFSTLFIYLYIIYKLITCLDQYKLKLINVFLILSIFMSLAIGGLNILSLLFTLLIFNHDEKFYDINSRIQWRNRPSTV